MSPHGQQRERWIFLATVDRDRDRRIANGAWNSERLTWSDPVERALHCPNCGAAEGHGWRFQGLFCVNCGYDCSLASPPPVEPHHAQRPA